MRSLRKPCLTICVSILLLLLVSPADAQVSSSLIGSWLIGEWDDNLALKDINEFVERTTDGSTDADAKKVFVALLPQLPVLEKNLEQTHMRFANLYALRRQARQVGIFDDRGWSETFSGQSRAAVSKLRSRVESVANDEKYPVGVRIASYIVLYQDASECSIALLGIELCNALSPGRSPASPELQEGLGTLQASLIDGAAKSDGLRQISCLWRLHRAINVNAPDGTSLSLAGKALADFVDALVKHGPQFHFAVPRGSDDELSRSKVSFDELGVTELGGINSVTLTFTQKRLFDGFRLGECSSWARSVFGFCPLSRNSLDRCCIARLILVNGA